MTKQGEKCVVAKGGKGGRGNASFKSNKDKAPKISEHGMAGEERKLKLELKLLADVGLVGFPSVGKSSLISVISASKPKIADYHFTTLTPNLGVVSTKSTSLVAYVLDAACIEGRDLVSEYQILLNEVKKYSEKLYNKKSIVIANKMDIFGSKENLENFKKAFPDVEVLETSAVTHLGIEELKSRLGELVISTNEESMYNDEEFESYVLYEFKNEKPYNITRIDDHTWVLSGEKLENLLKKTRFNSDEALLKFARKLKNMGVDDELKTMGAKSGDTVRILDVEFEFSEKLDY